jgi:3-oxoacyl-[acyl-carrier protein] reductase
MTELQGQVAFVTGCARLKGLGRGIALALAGRGADVAICDVSVTGTRYPFEQDDPDRRAGWEGLPSLVSEIERLGSRAVATVGDVGVRKDAERMAAEVVSQLGRIDILVNNAGAPHGNDRTWTWEVPEDAFDDVIRINTKGPFLMSSAVVRHMLQRGGAGRIVNISSTNGKVGAPKRAAYCASKFAVIGLTQVLALELAPRGITVNAICPGSMDTARMSSTRGQEPDTVLLELPVGRIGQPKDIGAMVAFLASPDASFITGQAINVNGGMFMG